MTPSRAALALLFERAVTGPRAPMLLAAAAAATLAAALFMQHVVGVQPCILCIYQRWACALAGMLALTALVYGRHRPLRVALLGLTMVALLGDAAIALFQVGVEQHWWAGTPGCGVPAPAASLEELRAQVLAGPIVRCDEVSWSLLGISLAGYNVMLSLAMAAFALMAARRAAHPEPPRHVA